jgi:hypothetical protein
MLHISSCKHHLIFFALDSNACVTACLPRCVFLVGRWFNGLFIASALVTAILYYAHYKAGSAEQMESLLPTTHKTAASKA